MKINSKLIYLTFLLFVYKSLFCYEIIRDPIFENYFDNLNKELQLKRYNVYLIKNKSANAFVIGDNIYFTTGLLKVIKEEDTLKSIYLHEYGHIVKNHSKSKRIEIIESRNKSLFYNLFSVGLAMLTGNANIGVGSSITFSKLWNRGR